MDTASLEVLLARGLSLEEIGRRFDRHPSTVAYWMRKHGLVAAKADKHAGRGGLALERLRPLVETGMTIAEIAAEVERSKATVRHWLGRYGLRTKNTRGRRPVEVMARAKEAGLLAVNMTCIRHGELSSRSRGAVTTGASGAGASRWRDIDARSRKHWWPKPAGRASSAGTTGA
jgi:transposase